jgi:hypothetical protein
LPFLKLASAVAREFASSFLLNFVFLFAYIFILNILKMQYGKYIGLRGNEISKSVKSLKELVKESAFFGAVTGFITSFAVIFLGITLEVKVFEYIILMSIGLSFINIRYICFSYSGGLLALGSLILGLQRIDIPSILALISILHLLESIMIYLNSGKDSIPVLIKKNNEIAGAFFVQKFWPVPIVLFTFINERRADGLGELIMGKWPMLFQPDLISSGVLTLGLGCIVSVLGYSDVAITKTPEKKSKETSIQLFIYSVVLFTIAIAAIHFSVFKIIGPIFAIGVHELIIRYGHYREKNGDPLFKTVRRGIKVFDLLPGSHGEKMGLQRGDTILSINGNDVQTDEGMAAALKDFPPFIWIEVADPYGYRKTYEYKCYPGGTNDIGVLTVPRENRITYNVEYFENISILKNLVSRFKGIDKQL